MGSTMNAANRFDLSWLSNASIEPKGTMVVSGKSGPNPSFQNASLINDNDPQVRP
jgi:hypothetical protein